mmetsp:Transcript_32844/g.106180  ORF Transcript_32844/g.106180 Transcript_32844/m.106180 type:complete len:251 (+) Transcript_32844:2977-3729(+)
MGHRPGPDTRHRPSAPAQDAHDQGVARRGPSQRPGQPRGLGRRLRCLRCLLEQGLLPVQELPARALRGHRSRQEHHRRLGDGRAEGRRDARRDAARVLRMLRRPAGCRVQGLPDAPHPLGSSSRFPARFDQDDCATDPARAQGHLPADSRQGGVRAGRAGAGPLGRLHRDPSVQVEQGGVRAGGRGARQVRSQGRRSRGLSIGPLQSWRRRQPQLWTRRARSPVRALPAVGAARAAAAVPTIGAAAAIRP